MKFKVRHFFKRHYEWVALSVGLLLMGIMNPYLDQGSSWCLFEIIGIPFCPGKGLGHSIAYSFRGDLSNALQANVIGPFSIIVILSRISLLLKKNFMHKESNN